MTLHNVSFLSDNGVCILCPGGVSEHETLGNVECYDPETDRWVVDVIPQMRYRRSGVGVAVLQGLLFAIGGYLEGKTSTDAVECYNPRTKRSGRWEGRERVE